ILSKSASEQDSIDKPSDTPASYPDGALIKVAGEPEVYVIKNGNKVWIASPDEFEKAGYKWGDIKIVSAEVLKSIGSVMLIRVEGDHKVYAIRNNKKRHIKSPDEFNAAGYKWSDIASVAPAVLAGYPDTTPSGVTLYRADGDSKVYVVKDNIKQWIKSAEEFNEAGYKWSDIVVTTPAAVAAFSDGSAAVTVKVVGTSSLRVRKSNTTRGAVLGSVKKNAIFTVLEEKSGWYKITMSNGVIGWISGAYAQKQ
ncbi:MAG: SH3 domain-containing protein, partial [Patescibacteria group bacterium]